MALRRPKLWGLLVLWGGMGLSGGAWAAEEPRVELTPPQRRYQITFHTATALDKAWEVPPGVHLDLSGAGQLRPAAAGTTGTVIYRLVPSDGAWRRLRLTYHYSLTQPADRIAVAVSGDGVSYEPVGVHTGGPRAAGETRDLTPYLSTGTTGPVWVKFYLYAAQDEREVALLSIGFEGDPPFSLAGSQSVPLPPNSAFAVALSALRAPRLAALQQGSPPAVAAGRGRESVGLDGWWRGWEDGEGVGHSRGFFRPDYDDSTWPWVAVPQVESGPDRASLWLRRRFRVPPGWAKKHTRLCFDGVDYAVEVWLNGHYLGAHEGYFTPFAFTTDGLLQYDGDNVLALRLAPPPAPRSGEEGGQSNADAAATSAPALLRGSLGRLGSGLAGVWRSVRMEARGDVALEYVRLRPELKENYTRAEVHFQAVLRNHRSEPLTVGLRACFSGLNFADAETYFAGRYTLPPGVSVAEGKVILTNPRLWWCWDRGTPNLYRVDVQVDDGREVTDALTTTLGLRELQVETGTWTWRLNGQRVFVRGVAYCPSHGLKDYATGTFLRDLRRLREANCNLVRPYAHVPPPEFFAACDAAGLLVWADFVLDRQADVPALRRAAAAQMQELLLGWGHHPSLALWCLAPVGEAPLAQYVAEQVQAVSPARPLLLSPGLKELLFPLPSATGAPAETPSEEAPAGEEQTKPSALELYRPWPLSQVQMPFLSAVGFQTRAEPPPQVPPEALKYAVEQLRRQKYAPVNGLIYFPFRDLSFAPTGVLDSEGEPKPTYAALQAAYLPLHVLLDYDPAGVRGLWVVNDQPRAYRNCRVIYRATTHAGATLVLGKVSCHLEADTAVCVLKVADWHLRGPCRVELKLEDATGAVLDRNEYQLFFPAGKQ